MSSSGFRLLPRAVDRIGIRIADRLARIFVALGLTPNAITGLAFAASCGSAYFLWRGRPLGAGLLIVVAGFLDMLDGIVARTTNRKTRYGAMLDSTLDRYAEFAMYAALGFRYRGRWPEALAVLAFLGSIMVSYTRARAEGLGFQCRSGIMQRAERLILLGLACLAACFLPIYDQAMIAALAAIAAASNATALQRLRLVRKWDRADRADGSNQSNTPRT